MFATITIAALLAAAPVSVVMQWNMHATNAGSVTFGTRYRAVSPGHDNSEESSRDFAVADLEKTFTGLTHAQLFGPATDVQFTVTRQEGTLTCAGRARAGTADGDFTFALDPRFASEVQSRGVGVVSQERQMEWLFQDADAFGLLDYFKSKGFVTPNIDLLSQAFNVGVTAKYVRDLDAAGMRPLTVEQLVRAAEHGVRARYITELTAYGFHDLQLDQAINLIDHGVSVSYLTGLSRLGYHVTPDQAINLVDHGVSIHYIETLRSAGYANLSVSDLVRLAEHGVH